MNNRKLTTTGMVALSCLFLIASVVDISACYIRNGRIVFLQNADILVAIEFVSTKMTVSFSKESLRSFFSSLLALIHDSASWRGTSTMQRLSVMAQELCLTPITRTEDTLNVVLNTKKYPVQSDNCTGYKQGRDPGARIALHLLAIGKSNSFRERAQATPLYPIS